MTSAMLVGLAKLAIELDRQRREETEAAKTNIERLEEAKEEAHEVRPKLKKAFRKKEFGGKVLDGRQTRYDRGPKTLAELERKKDQIDVKIENLTATMKQEGFQDEEKAGQAKKEQEKAVPQIGDSEEAVETRASRFIVLGPEKATEVINALGSSDKDEVKTPAATGRRRTDREEEHR